MIICPSIQILNLQKRIYTTELLPGSMLEISLFSIRWIFFHCPERNLEKIIILTIAIQAALHIQIPIIDNFNTKVHSKVPGTRMHHAQEIFIYTQTP